jgi:hypothetical protein
MARFAADPDRTAQAVEAFRLRAQGMSYRGIGSKLGISLATVQARLRLAEDAAGASTVAGSSALRRRLMAELDAWASRLDREYEAGRVEITTAIRAYVPIAARLAALGGADQPYRVEVAEAPEVRPDPQLMDAIRAELAEIQAADRAEIERDNDPVPSAVDGLNPQVGAA